MGLTILIFLLVIALVCFILAYIGVRLRVKELETQLEKHSDWKSPEDFEAALKVWKNNELMTVREMERTWALNNAQVSLVEWKQQEEARIRADAISRSTAVTKGKITEHLIPFFADFPYNPKDCRFLGSPVDLLIFSGLSDGDLEEVIFMEVKTGQSALSTRERQVRNKIQEGCVRWEELRV